MRMEAMGQFSNGELECHGGHGGRGGNGDAFLRNQAVASKRDSGFRS